MILTLPVTLYGIRCFIPAFVSYYDTRNAKIYKKLCDTKNFSKKN